MSSSTKTPAITEAQETAEEWSAYIRGVLSERGWRQLDLANYLDMDQRVVRYWVSGKVLPARSLRRALRLALMAPAEAEVMRCLIGALRAAQAVTKDSGGGGADGGAPRKDARQSQPDAGTDLVRSPSPPPPLTPSPAALAAALARRKKPDGQ